MLSHNLRSVPGSEWRFIILMICTCWILPLSLWIYLIKKSINIFTNINTTDTSDEERQIKQAFHMWNFELKRFNHIEYFYRPSLTISSSKKPTLLFILISFTFYCDTLGPPTERIKNLLYSLLEKYPNSSFLVVLTKSTEFNNEHAILLEDLTFSTKSEVIKFATDYETASSSSITNVVIENGNKYPCRLCLPNTSSIYFLSYREIFAIYTSIALRLITGQWPYTCKLKSIDQVKNQLRKELGLFECNNDLKKFRDIFQRQIEIFGELYSMMKISLLALAQYLIESIL